MTAKLFLLGRPGCGKSSAAKYISKYMKSKGWSAKRFRDFDILQTMTQEEQYKQKFKAVQEDRFDVVDDSVLAEALKRLNIKLTKYIKKVKSNETLLIIEFARNNYEEALKYFFPDVLQDAYFLFIDVDLNICMQRIEQRMIHPNPPDDHYVSEEMLVKYYTDQKFPENWVLQEKFKFLENNDGTLQDFTKKVHNVVEDIFK